MSLFRYNTNPCVGWSGGGAWENGNQPYVLMLYTCVALSIAFELDAILHVHAIDV